MGFLWITLSATIFLLQKGSRGQNSERLKSNPEAFCPGGWHSSGVFCFKGFSEKVNFENAEKQCAKQGAHLVKISSKEMQDYVTAKLLLPLGSRSYIGLRHNATTDTFHWPDGSEVEFTAWDANEPSKKARDNTDEQCVEMTYNDDLKRLGKWNDVSCYQHLTFICQKVKDSDTERPEKERNHCSQTLDGISFRDSCFHLSLHLKTWEEAETYCVEHYNGHLASITDAAVQRFLHYEAENYHAAHRSLWIGIRLKPDEIALWSSGWYLGFINWKDKAASEKVSSTSCAAMSTESGEWTTGSCDKQLSFICENSSVIPPGKLKAKTPGLKCPSVDWIDLGGDYCYIFDKKSWVSWYQANFLCMRKGGTLASIHSKHEQEVLAQFFRLFPVGVHIGLFRHDHGPTKGEFGWMDHSPVDYVNWRYGEPNDRNEICTEAMPFQEMLWNDIKCENSGFLICSVPKKASANSTEQMPSESGQKECGCLPTPAIVGVVLCVLFVIILLGVVTYNVKPWMKARQQDKKNRKSSLISERPRYRTGEAVVSDAIYENIDSECCNNTNRDTCGHMDIGARTASFP